MEFNEKLEGFLRKKPSSFWICA